MTAMSEFDRLLGSVIEADGPQSVPASLVDGALAEARTIPQRRPIVSVLDQRAWPAGRLSFGDPRTARLVRLGILAMLTLALVAVALAGAANRSPSLLADDERLLVWAPARNWEGGGSGRLFGPGGATDDVTSEELNGCPRLVPGTTFAWNYFGPDSVSLVDLTVPGQEFARWTPSSEDEWLGTALSPDGTRAALIESPRSVTIMTLNGSEPDRTTFDAPGILSVAWSLDGSRLALVRVEGDALAFDLIDALTKTTTSVYRTGYAGAIAGAEIWLDWESDGHRIALWIEGIALTDVAGSGPLIFLDLASGTASARERLVFDGGQYKGAWTQDGTRYAVQQSKTTLVIADAASDGNVAVGLIYRAGITSTVTDLAWSPDGRSLAFLHGGRLVVVDRTGANRRDVPIGSSRFVWSTDGTSLLVASTLGDGRVTVGRYESADLTEVVRVASWPTEGRPSPEASLNLTTAQIDDMWPLNVCLWLDP